LGRTALIEVLAETGSTNADLAARVVAGSMPAEGDWLVADRQRAGRGRQGRAWFDGTGNFMGSTVVHARPGDPPLHTLALVAGLSVQGAIAGLLPSGVEVLLKWPNDVLCGKAKLAGILLERVGDVVVVGVGVNLAVAPPVEGRETASLAQFGAQVERNAFAEDLAGRFAADLERWRASGLGPVITRWTAAAHPTGTPLLVGEPGELPLSGAFAGLDSDGALILALPGGTTRTIHAGEVRLGDSDSGSN